MDWTFNPPPGWPPVPPGYRPPAGFQPDPSWPVAPADWQYWIPAQANAPVHAPAYTPAPAPAFAPGFAPTQAHAVALAPMPLPGATSMPGFDPAAPMCRFCQGVPALKATARAHRGMIIIMTFRKIEGPFCRSCGLAVTRKLSADTLVQGWWGYFSAVISPIVLIMNAVLLHRLARLAPAPYRQGQIDPGAPLFHRPQAAGLALPALLIVLLVANLAR
jgi:hypothetical protein